MAAFLDGTRNLLNPSDYETLVHEIGLFKILLNLVRLLLWVRWDLQLDFTQGIFLKCQLDHQMLVATTSIRKASAGSCEHIAFVP